MDKRFKKLYSSKKDAVYDLVFAQLSDGDGKLNRILIIKLWREQYKIKAVDNRTRQILIYKNNN